MPAPDNPMLQPFLAAADRAADERPDVDRDMARELMEEAATMLHNGLALEGVDEHDVPAVIEGLAAALTDPDPAEGLRRWSRATLEQPGDLRDPEAASATYLVAAAMFQI